MKITRSKLQQIIKEEMAAAIKEIGGGDYGDTSPSQKVANLYKFKRGEMVDSTMPARAREIKKLIDQKQTESKEFEQLTTAIRSQVVNMLGLYPPDSHNDILARVEKYLSPHLSDEKPYYVKLRSWIMTGKWPK